MPVECIAYFFFYLHSVSSFFDVFTVVVVVLKGEQGAIFIGLIHLGYHYFFLLLLLSLVYIISLINSCDLLEYSFLFEL